jgi:hypothetical protein
MFQADLVEKVKIVILTTVRLKKIYIETLEVKTVRAKKYTPTPKYYRSRLEYLCFKRLPFSQHLKPQYSASWSAGRLCH